MRYSIIQLKRIANDFCQELINSNKGLKSSLLFAQTPLPKVSLVSMKNSLQVLMIGGSHLESATAKLVSGQIELSNFYQRDLPKLTNSEIFFKIIEETVKPETEILSVNFAFPIQPISSNNKLDGVLINGPKGHDFKGLIGKQVGLEIENYLQKIRGQKIQVTLANDTLALGLATKEFSSFNWKNCAVGIVGTGTNFGIFKDETCFVNLESGSFNLLDRTESGKLIDLESSNRGKQLFEKEVGGNYLVQHFNIDAKLNGLNLEIENSKQLSDVAKNPSHPGQYIASEIFARSSQLVASQIYGIWQYKQILKELELDSKLNILMEGSLYWKGFEYYNTVDFYLEQLGLARKDYQIYNLENMGLIGIARLAL